MPSRIFGPEPPLGGYIDQRVWTLVAYSSGLAAQVDWLGPKVDSHSALFGIHQRNRVNSAMVFYDDYKHCPYYYYAIVLEAASRV